LDNELILAWDASLERNRIPNPKFQPPPIRVVDDLLKGWLGAHWVARAMSSGAQTAYVSAEHQASANHYDQSPAPVMTRGGRTLATANSIFSLSPRDAGMHDNGWEATPLPLPNPLPIPGQDSQSQPWPNASTEPWPVNDVQTGQRGVIEDSTAEALRPLLQQWLSDHIGGVMAKALAMETKHSRQPQ
jgi:hypothetical protein